jgi:hypothetical protein
LLLPRRPLLDLVLHAAAPKKEPVCTSVHVIYSRNTTGCTIITESRRYTNGTVGTVDVTRGVDLQGGPTGLTCKDFRIQSFYSDALVAQPNQITHNNNNTPPHRWPTTHLPLDPINRHLRLSIPLFRVRCSRLRSNGTLGRPSGSDEPAGESGVLLEDGDRQQAPRNTRCMYCDALVAASHRLACMHSDYLILSS